MQGQSQSARVGAPQNAAILGTLSAPPEAIISQYQDDYQVIRVENQIAAKIQSRSMDAAILLFKNTGRPMNWD